MCIDEGDKNLEIPSLIGKNFRPRCALRRVTFCLGTVVLPRAPQHGTKKALLTVMDGGNADFAWSENLPKAQRVIRYAAMTR